MSVNVEVTIKKKIGDTVFEVTLRDDEKMELCIWEDGRLKVLLDLDYFDLQKVSEFILQAKKTAELMNANT